MSLESATLRDYFLPRSPSFWAKVAYGPESQCWEWQAGKDRDGYGQLKVRLNGRAHSARAHRISYLLSGGNLAASEFLLHSCDNPSCVNPRHLAPGTQSENKRQMVERGRMQLQHGEANPNNKLTDKTAGQILAILAKPDRPTQKEIARQFGVSQMTISFLHQRKTWRHLQETAG
jgi:hypothetical protein